MNPARYGMAIAALLFAAIQQGSALWTSGDLHLPSVRSPARDSPNVILYLVDSLRADHLGCYGYGSPISPNIDGFARDATLFERTLAQSSWTRPSVASIMTGRYPREHGVEERWSGLKRTLPAIAPILRRGGYATAAFVTSAVVTDRFGFANGFDDFRQDVKESIEPRMPTSEWVTARAIDWLSRRSDARPFFLYLHTLDPHMPYTPPAMFRDNFAPAANPASGSFEHVVGLRDGKLKPGARDSEEITALYDAEIAANDAAFGVLLGYLRARGLYDSTLIVFISDHGEEFLDHGGWEHAATLYQEMLRVPLIVRFPGGRAAGMRCRAVARHVDVLPTVLDIAGLQSMPGVAGRSLYAALNERLESDPISYATLSVDRRKIDCLVARGWKLIQVSRHERLRPGIELYDIENDPGEKVDCSLTRRVIVDALLSTLRSHPTSHMSAPADLVPIDPQTERELRALGYF